MLNYLLELKSESSYTVDIVKKLTQRPALRCSFKAECGTNPFVFYI